MIKINQLKLPVGHSQKDLEDKIRKTLRIPSKETFHYEVMRRSLDARKKPSLFYVYCIYVTIRQENSIVKKLHQPSVSFVTETGYRFSRWCPKFYECFQYITVSSGRILHHRV